MNELVMYRVVIPVVAKRRDGTEAVGTSSVWKIDEDEAQRMVDEVPGRTMQRVSGDEIPPLVRERAMEALSSGVEGRERVVRLR